MNAGLKPLVASRWMWDRATTTVWRIRVCVASAAELGPVAVQSVLVDSEFVFFFYNEKRTMIL